VVVDKFTQATLPFATLFFSGTKTGTTSDLDGKYIFDTYYSSDTLICTMVGYNPVKKKVQQGKSQELRFELEPNTQMTELVITDEGWEDPAIALIKKVLNNKKINNREKLDAYEYESYTKVEFDLNNIKESLADKKILKSFEFVFDQMDTTQEKNYLPIFMTESLSDVCFRRTQVVERGDQGSKSERCGE
jgi:hypothetical protein